MTQGARVQIVLAWLLCAVQTGCGSTGTTSVFVLQLDIPPAQQVSEVRIASAAMHPDAAVLNLVNVRPWGKFEPSDLRNIEQSLRDTLAPLAKPSGDAGGKLIYHEHFYAADSVYLIGTMGLLKDDVHKAIVRRIATKSLALEAKPRAFPGTYDTLEEAVSVLPQTLVSMGIPGLGLLTPSGMSTVQWDVARPSQEFDWPGYLGEIRR